MHPYDICDTIAVGRITEQLTGMLLDLHNWREGRFRSDQQVDTIGIDHMGKQAIYLKP